MNLADRERKTKKDAIAGYVLLVLAVVGLMCAVYQRSIIGMVIMPSAIMAVGYGLRANGTIAGIQWMARLWDKDSDDDP